MYAYQDEIHGPRRSSLICENVPPDLQCLSRNMFHCFEFNYQHSGSHVYRPTMVAPISSRIQFRGHHSLTILLSPDGYSPATTFPDAVLFVAGNLQDRCGKGSQISSAPWSPFNRKMPVQLTWRCRGCGCQPQPIHIVFHLVSLGIPVSIAAYRVAGLGIRNHGSCAVFLNLQN